MKTNPNDTKMTKLEAFTLAAMQGLCGEDAGSQITRNDVESFLELKEDSYDWKTHWPIYVGKMSVRIALKTIAALNESKTITAERL